MPHIPTEFNRYVLPLGERLLVTLLSGTEVALAGSPPWYWQVETVDPVTVVASGTVSGTAARMYDYVTLDSGTFGPHVGTTLWLSVFSGTTGPSGSPHAVSRFHLSGIYEFSGTQVELAGLLGENSVTTSPSGSDYQSGHLRHSRTILYADATLSQVLNQLDFERDFVKDFTPDQRFFTENEREKEV